jgi:hypothetical protein
MEEFENNKSLNLFDFNHVDSLICAVYSTLPNLEAQALVHMIQIKFLWCFTYPYKNDTHSVLKHALATFHFWSHVTTALWAER